MNWVAGSEVVFGWLGLFVLSNVCSFDGDCLSEEGGFVWYELGSRE